MRGESLRRAASKQWIAVGAIAGGLVIGAIALAEFGQRRDITGCLVSEPEVLPHDNRGRM